MRPPTAPRPPSAGAWPRSICRASGVSPPFDPRRAAAGRRRGPYQAAATRSPTVENHSLRALQRRLGRGSCPGQALQARSERSSSRDHYLCRTQVDAGYNTSVLILLVESTVFGAIVHVRGPPGASQDIDTQNSVMASISSECPPRGTASRM